MKSKFNSVQELVYGAHPIHELLKAKRRQIKAIYTLKPEPKSFAAIRALLPKYIHVEYRSREELSRLAGTTDHQGIVAWAGPFVWRKKPFDPKEQRVLLMLDGIQDTRNLGAILRSAYCTGVHGVVVTRKRSAPMNASAIKASAGLAEHVQMYQVASAKQGIQELKAAGYHIYIAALAKNSQDAARIAYQAPMCVVIGSEGTGVSADILGQGTVVTLPQRTADISYNASVAAGILLFLVAMQQHLLFVK
jgi:23S rRNA (guanosine2251-2'-O)-methyltransferase